MGVLKFPDAHVPLRQDALIQFLHMDHDVSARRKVKRRPPGARDFNPVEGHFVGEAGPAPMWIRRAVS